MRSFFPFFFYFSIGKLLLVELVLFQMITKSLVLNVNLPNFFFWRMAMIFHICCFVIHFACLTCIGRLTISLKTVRLAMPVKKWVCELIAWAGASPKLLQFLSLTSFCSFLFLLSFFLSRSHSLSPTYSFSFNFIWCVTKYMLHKWKSYEIRWYDCMQNM